MDKLLPDRHPQADLFVPNILDGNPKDDMGSMEHPMFALRAGDRRIRRYEHNNNSIEITPSILGLATIFDKDILIYCTSVLTEAMNEGRKINRNLRITAHDLLVATNRDTSGSGYKSLREALKRLQGTMITTNIKTGGERFEAGFGLIDSWFGKVDDPDDPKSRMLYLDITLSEWLYKAILSNQVLTIDRDYFRIRKPLERRLYEIARKHCGNQRKWVIGLELLSKKAGSHSAMKRFRQLVLEICDHQHLPGYRIQYDDIKRLVTFYPRKHAGFVAELIGEKNSPGN